MVGTDRGFGVAGALALDLVQTLAKAAETAGYRTFWVNDTPTGDGLAALLAAAEATERIGLGVGVIPLDRQPAERIAARVAKLGLPTERLLLGIGAGGSPGGLGRVRAGAVALQGMTAATVVVGALGPKMCRLAGEVADGVLLNWLTPDFVSPSARLVADAAAAAGRPTPRLVGYVRCALGSAAAARLREEADRYGSYPAYAAHFERMGATPMATAVVGDSAESLRRVLAEFDRGLDETVVRAITADEGEVSYLDLLAAAAPA